MSRRSPSPMETKNVSDDESGHSRSSSRGRSVTPMTRKERRLRQENECLRKANEAQEKRIEELQEQVKAMARQLLDQGEEANRRQEELLRRLPQEDKQSQVLTKGKRKKEQAPRESGSGEEPAKLPRQAKPQPSNTEEPTRTTPKAPTTETAGPSKEGQRKEDKIPPVILRKKEKWTDISELLKQEKINFTRAKLTGEGIAITPATVQDHRRLTATLNRTREEYHTYSL